MGRFFFTCFLAYSFVGYAVAIPWLPGVSEFPVPGATANRILSINRGGANAKGQVPKSISRKNEKAVSKQDSASRKMNTKTLAPTATVKGASVPNEIFNLVKSIVGAGVLGLPAGK